MFATKGFWGKMCLPTAAQKTKVNQSGRQHHKRLTRIVISVSSVCVLAKGYLEIAHIKQGSHFVKTSTNMDSKEASSL